MDFLRSLSLFVCILSFPVVSADIYHEVGVKTLQRELRPNIEVDKDIRPYYQFGVLTTSTDYRWQYGMAVNIAPNSFNGETAGIVNVKLLDLYFDAERLLRGKVNFSFGMLRYDRAIPGWGYSIATGYSTVFGEYEFISQLGWTRTNGDNTEPTAASLSDNLIWLDVGFRF